MFKIILEQEEKDSNIYTIRFNGKLPERYKMTFDDFFAAYSIISIREASLPLEFPLKPKHERECRFCGERPPAVSFKKRAHLVPELLGNKKMFSDFECDSCNARFGRNENDLANFLGFTRSFSRIKGKTGIPKFKSPDETLIIKEGYMSESDTEKKIVIESLGEGNDHFVLDPSKKKLVLNSVRHSYTPFNVYKAFLKVALSIIDESEVSKYSKAMDILMDRAAVQDEASGFFTLPLYVFPGPAFPAPLLLLFEKKEQADLRPTHIAAIYFHNYIYQIALPFYDGDEWMYDGKKQVVIQIAPPFVDEPWAEHFGYPTQKRMNFSKRTRVKGEKQTVTFSFHTTLKLPDEQA